MTQPFTVLGSILELHAARAHLGVSQGHNEGAETQFFDTSGSGNHGTLTSFAGTEYEAATNLFKWSRLVGDVNVYCQHIGTYHGTPVWTKVAEGDGSYYEQCVYTLGAGDGASHNFGAASLESTDLGAFAPGDPVSFAVEYQLTVSNARSCTGGRVSLGNQLYTSWVESATTAQSSWTKCETNIASLAAGTTGVLWYVTVDLLATMVAGDTITLKWRRPIARKATSAGPYFSGKSLGCEWSGTADASVSTHGDGWVTSGWDGSGTIADPHRLVFDGANDYVAIPDLSAAENKAVTYEAWIKANPIPSGNHAIIYESTSGNAPVVSMYLNPGGYLEGQVWPAGWTGGVGISGAEVDDGLMHHCAMTISGSGGVLYLYVDGVRYGPSSAVPSSAGLNETRLSGSVGGYVDGGVVVARIYPFALTPTQVAQNYAAGYLWPPDASPGGPGIYTTGPYIKIGSFDIPVFA